MGADPVLMHRMKVQRYLGEESAMDAGRSREVLSLLEFAQGCELITRTAAGYRYTATTPRAAAGIHAALDDLDPLTEVICALVQDIKAGPTKYLVALYDELLAYRVEILEAVATGGAYELDEMVREMITRLRVRRNIAGMKRRVPDHRAMYAKLSREVLEIAAAQGFDPDLGTLARWEKSDRPMPLEVWKWLIAKKIPRSETVVAICQDYAARWRLIETRLATGRDEGWEGDFYWKQLWSERDKMIADWKDAVSVVVFGRVAAPGRAGGDLGGRARG